MNPSRYAPASKPDDVRRRILCGLLVLALDAKEPVLRDSTGQEVTERRFDEGRQRVASSFGLGKEAVQFGGHDSVAEPWAQKEQSAPPTPVEQGG